MTVAEPSVRRLEIGRVIVQTFQAIRDNILLYSVLSFIVAVPSLLVRYQQDPMVSGGNMLTSAYLLSVTAFVVAYFLLIAAMAKAMLLDRTGYRSSLKDCFAEIAGDIYPVAVIAIISSFITVTALVLAPVEPLTLTLLIPGFYVQVVLAIVVPVRTIERADTVAAITRSMTLTRGHRWPLFGLLMASTVLSLGAEFIVYAAFSDPAFAESVSAGRAQLLLIVLVDMANSVINAVASAVIYFELRLIKEGVAPDAVAAEFD